MPYLKHWKEPARAGVLALVAALLFYACSGGTSGDWYYHWDCHGDSECLSTNPTGAPSGTADEGPVQVNCTQLLTFARHFWGAAATDSCDQNTGGGSGPSTPTLASLVVTPSSATITVGQAVQLTAMGHYSDGSSKDLTSLATWSVAGTRVIGQLAVATVSAGLVSGVSAGNAQVQASYGSLTGSAAIFVTATTLAGLTVTPQAPTLEAGARQQFIATAIYTNGSSVDVTATAAWSSSVVSVAAFNVAHLATPGLATALAGGTTTISAQYGGRSGSATLTVYDATLVSIAVLPADPTIAAGLTLQFTARGTYSNNTSADLTAQVAWTSGIAAVASIAAGGLAKGLSIGTSTIAAALGAVSGGTTLTVGAVALESLEVTPATPTVTQGQTQPLIATGHYSDGSSQNLTSASTWTSATPAVASVTAAGVVTALTLGISVVTAASGGKSGAATVTVIALGAVWSQPSSGTAVVLNGVAWCSGKFIAVGAAGTILTSPDGSTWTAQTSGTASDLYAVGCSPGLTLAAGQSGAMVTSTDGSAWTVITPAGATGAIRMVTWNGTQFFVGGDFGYVVGTAAGVGDLAASADLTTWSMRDPSIDGSARSLAWSGSRYMLAIGGVQTSTDGINWGSPQSTQMLYGVAWTGTTFALVGALGLVYLTTDATGFTFPQSQTQNQLNAVTWSGAQLTAVGNAGTVITSPDANNWTARTSGTSANLLGVAGSGSRLVAVGSGGTVLLSH